MFTVELRSVLTHGLEPLHLIVISLVSHDYLICLCIRDILNHLGVHLE